MSNASEYADSLHRTIIANTEADAPFGWTNDDDDWTTSDQGETESDTYADGPNPWRPASAMGYISDALDIEYIIGSDRAYKDGRVFVTVGGPTAWIDTEKRALVVTWMSEPEVRNLPAAFIDGLDDALSELWEMGA